MSSTIIKSSHALNIKETIDRNIDMIQDLRKKLNQHAELSFQEYKTQEIIMDFFCQLGMATKKSLATGVVALLKEADECIAVRADMDALPVNGISHACGHDFHMAIVCGVALVLKELGYDKSVKFIFQPGEEADGGALPMINEGVLDFPKVTKMIGFHVWPNVKVGTIEAAAGPSMGSVDDFKIVYKGKGGHAAIPNLCRNPLYPAIDLVQTMNEKSRMEISPLDSHVITFSSIQCGNAPNVIADECVVKGTVRTFDNRLRDKIYQDMQQISHLCAEKYGCQAEVDYDFQYPPLLNDEPLTKDFIEVTRKLIGPENVLPLEKTFAAEDFAFFAEKVPSVHFRLGIANESKGLHPLHSVHFDAAEEAIFHGIYIITNYLLSL